MLAAWSSRGQKTATATVASRTGWNRTAAHAALSSLTLEHVLCSQSVSFLFFLSLSKIIFWKVSHSKKQTKKTGCKYLEANNNIQLPIYPWPMSGCVTHKAQTF